MKSWQFEISSFKTQIQTWMSTPEEREARCKHLQQCLSNCIDERAGGRSEGVPYFVEQLKWSKCE